MVIPTFRSLVAYEQPLLEVAINFEICDFHVSASPVGQTRPDLSRLWKEHLLWNFKLMMIVRRYHISH